MPVRAGFNSRYETCAIPAAPCAQTHKKKLITVASVFPGQMGTIISSGYAVGEGDILTATELYYGQVLKWFKRTALKAERSQWCGARVRISPCPPAIIKGGNAHDESNVTLFSGNICRIIRIFRYTLRQRCWPRNKEHPEKVIRLETEKGVFLLEERNIGLVGILVGMVIFVVAAFMCVTRIGPGYAGVIYNMDGGIQDETLAQGFHMVAPWKHVIEYPISTETVYYTKNNVDGDDKDKKTDKSVNVNTKDGKQVNVSVTYAYHMDVEKLPTVFAKFRGQDIEVIQNGYMKNAMYEALNNVTSQYSLMELVGDKRPEINQKIFETFKADLEECGIVIETFNLSDVVPDEATATAIQNVVNAQNELTKVEIDKKTAEQEALKKIAEAKGDAEAARIRAEGEAEANRLLSASLDANVLEKAKISKWDGKLPQYQLSNGTGIILGQ